MRVWWSVLICTAHLHIVVCINSVVCMVCTYSACAASIRNQQQHLDQIPKKDRPPETRPKSQDESKGPELHGGVTSAHNNRTFSPHQHRQGFKAWRSLALLLFQNREIDTPRRPSGPLNLLRTAGTVPTMSIGQYGLHAMTLTSRVRPILPVLWCVAAAL